MVREVDVQSSHPGLSPIDADLGCYYKKHCRASPTVLLFKKSRASKIS
jgi:hypothetical protein